jgi:hypothetical protein
MVDSVRASLATVTPGRDEAAGELALTYAAEIDAGGDLEKLGPQLLAVLEALHLTPRARGKGVDSEPAEPSPLDALRARRADRANRAATMDPAAT